MVKSKFLFLQNSDMSAIVNFSDIVYIYNNAQTGFLEIFVRSNICDNPINKLLRIKHNYDEIKKEFENNDDFKFFSNMIVNKYYDNLLLGSFLYDKQYNKLENFDFEDILEVSIRKGQPYSSDTATATVKVLLSDANIENNSYVLQEETDLIKEQIECRDDFIKIDRSGVEIKYVKIDNVISFTKVGKKIYILTYLGLDQQIILSFDSEVECEMYHSIILGKLNLTAREEEEETDLSDWPVYLFYRDLKWERRYKNWKD